MRRSGTCDGRFSASTFAVPAQARASTMDRPKSADVVAALDWLHAQYKLPIVAVGFSFGAAMVIAASCGSFAPSRRTTTRSRIGRLGTSHAGLRTLLPLSDSLASAPCRSYFSAAIRTRSPRKRSCGRRLIPQPIPSPWCSFRRPITSLQAISNQMQKALAAWLKEQDT